ncbi:MAG: hypothetical protein QM487_08745 [Candidatus Marithrix sp.]
METVHILLVLPVQFAPLQSIKTALSLASAIKFTCSPLRYCCLQLLPQLRFPPLTLPAILLLTVNVYDGIPTCIDCVAVLVLAIPYSSSTSKEII